MLFWPVGSTGKTCALRPDGRRAPAVQRQIGRAIFASLEYFRSNEAPHFRQYFLRESDMKNHAVEMGERIGPKQREGQIQVHANTQRLVVPFDCMIGSSRD